MFSAGNGAACTPSDGLGNYSCTVPAGWSGSVTPGLDGFSFSPVSRSYAGVVSDTASQDYTAAVTTDLIWLDDGVPAGAVLAGSWNWVSGDPVPMSGSLAHQSALSAGLHQHYFYNALETLSVNPGDTLFAYVYLDPVNPPSEVMVQWNDGSWNHRAYWGANNIGWGVDGTEGRRHMGALPPVGQWVRLEVPAALVGLEGRTVHGMAFTLYDGRATWDTTGLAQ